MKHLALTANIGKPHARDVIGQVAACATRLGVSLYAGDELRAWFGSSTIRPLASDYAGIDVVMALGGDGTMLSAVRGLAGREIPLIGVNIGALGFMTSVAQGDLERAMECLARGEYRTSERILADCEVQRAGTPPRSYQALNDVVISNGSSMRVIALDLHLNGDPVTTYVCDGLIVSTPTGSTGHSLSSGGPILTPETRAFVISLICPHTLSTRPLVVPDASEISVRIARAAGKVVLAVDGQVGEALDAGDGFRIRRAARPVRFIHLPGYSYFAVLRQKLHWSGSNV